MFSKPTRDAYGHALIELAEANIDIEVFDADLAKSTRTSWFQERFPERFHNMGIAEANMVGVAAGLSLMKKIPFVTTYSIFIGRAFDQIRQAVCYSRTNVKIVATHAGLAASYDGGSHQGLEDLALMRVLPGMVILSPADYHQAKQAVHAAANIQGPVYIRLGKEDVPCFTREGKPFEIGKADLLLDGKDIAIIATGALVHKALSAAIKLKEVGISASVINMATIKPLDEKILYSQAEKCGRMIVAEEHNRIGGLYGAVAEYLARVMPIPLIPVAMNDQFGETGPWQELLEKYGLSENGIIAAARKILKCEGKI